MSKNKDNVLYPELMKFTPKNEKAYTEVTLLIETGPEEQVPSFWHWDTITYPNRVIITGDKMVHALYATEAGMQIEVDKPKCEHCQDRHYRLEPIKDKAELQRFAIYYAYFLEAFVRVYV